MPLHIQVDEAEFLDHVKSICKRNLQRPAIICTKCPFRHMILDVMDILDLPYSKEMRNAEVDVRATKES